MGLVCSTAHKFRSVVYYRVLDIPMYSQSADLAQEVFRARQTRSDDRLGDWGDHCRHATGKKDFAKVRYIRVLQNTTEMERLRCQRCLSFWVLSARTCVTPDRRSLQAATKGTAITPCNWDANSQANSTTT
jgi:hypothetical protein